MWTVKRRFEYSNPVRQRQVFSAFWLIKPYLGQMPRFEAIVPSFRLSIFENISAGIPEKT